MGARFGRLVLAGIIFTGWWLGGSVARAETVTVHWNLKAYETDNLPRLTQDLNRLASRGFVPAAMSLQGGNLWVMTIKNCPLYTSQDWSLEHFEDLAVGLRRRLASQSIPVGLASDPAGKYWVMFSRMPTLEVLAWKVDRAPSTRTHLDAALTKHLKAGFVPVALDRRAKTITVIYLKVKGWTFKSWKLDSAKQNVLETGINNHLSQGWIPVGLVFGRPTLVLYIR